MIYLPIFHITETVEEQLDKVKEEVNELIESIKNGESSKRQREECIDVIQSAVNLLYKLGTDTEVVISTADHYVKMKNRKYQFKSELKISRNESEVMK